MKMTFLFSFFAFAVFLMTCVPSQGGSETADTKQVQAFLADHVRQIEPKLKAMALADWNANATGEKKHYEEKAGLELEIRKIYSSKQEYDLLKKWVVSGAIADPLLRRQVVLLYNSYLVNQIDVELTKKIVDKGAEIAGKFNTFRPDLDGRQVSENEIKVILKDEIDSAKRRKAWEAGKEVGKAVSALVVELVKLRNQAAVKLGFRNYYEMSLTANEQSVAEITSLFDELDRLTAGPFRKLKQEIDTELAKKYSIPTERMRPWHYQDPFFQEPPQIGSIDLDTYYRGKKVDELGRAFYAGIGLPVDDILKRSDIYGRAGKYQHAFATDIDRRGDVRTMLSITDDYYWAGTILHELGHCVYSKNVDRNLPFLLRSEAHAFLTEAIAMLMERQASNADWLQTMVGIDGKEREAIRSYSQENLRRKALIFSRWEQVMMRFEKGLYENPDQDLNRLWWDLVKRYQGITPPEGRQAPDWAAKIHLAQYPAYYHNYQLGELAASQLQNYIVKNILKMESSAAVSFAGKEAVGAYLKSRVFAPGAGWRWDDLMKQATGETLTAKYFAAEYVK